jgi:lipopolysaccharide transport system ATP-binding protein
VSIAAQLTGVGKRYRKYDDNPLLIASVLRLRRNTRRTTLWALRGVDLEVQEGECVGVIGRNGSGKSTMLQVLAGVTAPTEGRISVKGRVAPLLGVGVGFDNELTGRENIYLNGTILGLTRAEIDGALDEIIDFSDIGPFIDTPVKFYSSGMTVRVGFAVAAQARPDVMLLDEVLAVGDIAFQMKCFDRMADIINSGATVFLVTHNMNAVRRLCSRTLVLHKGRPRFLGDTDQAIQEYHDAIAEDAPPVGGQNEFGVLPVLPDKARVVNVEPSVEDGHVSAAVTFEVQQRCERVRMAFFLATKTGVPVYMDVSPEFGPLDPGTHRWVVRTTQSVPGGDYAVGIGLRSVDPLAHLDRPRPVDVHVPARRKMSGVIDLGGRIRVSTR